MDSEKVLLIPQPQLSMPSEGLWRVEAIVEGHPVYIEASVPLSPRPEVFLCSFYFPAMSKGWNLRVAGGLDSVSLKNLAFIQAQAMDWWPGFGGGDVGAEPVARAEAGRERAAFYTGGVDSSYVLQHLHAQLGSAVFVEGFDIPLGDEERLRATRASLRATAAECGLKLLVVRTNLREHPVFKFANWETTHIAALASVAHALGRHFHTLYVAASDVPPPFGTAPDLDAAWSSASVSIENFSAELSRLERVRSIARWEPLRGRLRVCWENSSIELNCGFCEKCVRTRLQLLVSGAESGLDSFPKDQPLIPAMRRIVVDHALVGQWQQLVPLIEDRKLRRAVEKTMRRKNLPFFERAKRKTRRILVKLGL